MLEHVISVSGALGGGGTIGSTEDAEPTTAPEMISGARPEDEMHGDDNGLREQNAAARKRKVADEGNFDANKEEEDDDDDLGIAFTVLDLSRVIFEKLLDGSHTQESHQESKGKGKFKPELHLVTGETWSKREIESEFAEVRNDLGHIRLETGAFMSQN